MTWMFAKPGDKKYKVTLKERHRGRERWSDELELNCSNSKVVRNRWKESL